MTATGIFRGIFERLSSSRLSFQLWEPWEQLFEYLEILERMKIRNQRLFSKPQEKQNDF